MPDPAPPGPGRTPGPRILLCNDDSVTSTGIGVLERIARTLSGDVWICAPEVEQSGASHALTIHQPLRLRRLAERRWAVNGTPTDCVLLAVNHLLRGHKPDLILSGVNHGRNLADDMTYSGTVGVAMEGTLLGIRSIALSQELPKEGPVNWDTVERWAPEVLGRVLAMDWPPNVLLNINFPAAGPDRVKGIAAVPHGSGKIGDQLFERADPRGRSYFWIGTVRSRNPTPGVLTDVDAVEQGWVTVTPLTLDLTHYPMIDALRGAFS